VAAEEESEGADEALDTSFFATQATVAMPVCEPLVDSRRPVAAPPAEATPEPPPMANWEALSVPEPRNSRWRLIAAGAALILAVNVAYRFYLPMAPLPTAQQLAMPPAADGAKSVSARNDATTAAPGPEVPASVVKANIPEIIPMEAPHQRVVLVSKMTAPEPAHGAAGDARAPEVSVTRGEAPSTSGKGAGLLATNAVPPPPPEPAPETVAKPEDTLIPARLVSSVQPAYPSTARSAQIQGSVVVEAEIDASGSVTRTKVVSGPAALRAAATSALMRWKFQPARLKDQPVPSTTVVTLHFSLR
jgi:periplasmic protein TonB